MLAILPLLSFVFALAGLYLVSAFFVTVPLIAAILLAPVVATVVGLGEIAAQLAYVAFGLCAGLVVPVAAAFAVLYDGGPWFC